MSAVGVGVIGSGVISDTYLENLTSFPDLDVVIVGGRNQETARAQAEKHGVPEWGTVDDVLAHPSVQIVANLTVPAVHVEISAAAIAAGKHVWTEKPIGLDLPSVNALIASADTAGLRVGSAPDSLLGPGFQTAKRAIENGAIGDPLFAHTSFQTQGPDLWHPSPEFLFARGAGPLFDMGPYYFSALVSLLGPVDRVAAAGVKARAEREIRTGPSAGEHFAVEVPTTLDALTVFEGSQQAHSLLSFDSPLERHGVMEIHGTEGSILVPDPNRFIGRTAIVRPLSELSDGQEIHQPWIEVAEKGVVAGRGLGLLEMARAIAHDRPHIASGALASHVLDVLLSVERSVVDERFVTVDSSVPRVPSLPEDFDPFASTI